MRTLYLLVVIYIGALLTSCSTISAEQPVNTGISTTGEAIKKTPEPYIQKPGCPPLKKKQNPKSTTTETPATSETKNPQSIAFYQKESQLRHHYKIIGKSIVSKYNDAGIKRQEAVVRDHLRKVAAAMGGDAVIEIKRNSNDVTGAIVSYVDDENKANA